MFLAAAVLLSRRSYRSVSCESLAVCNQQAMHSTLQLSLSLDAASVLQPLARCRLAPSSAPRGVQSRRNRSLVSACDCQFIQSCSNATSCIPEHRVTLIKILANALQGKLKVGGVIHVIYSGDWGSALPDAGRRRPHRLRPRPRGLPACRSSAGISSPPEQQEEMHTDDRQAAVRARAGRLWPRVSSHISPLAWECCTSSLTAPSYAARAPSASA